MAGQIALTVGSAAAAAALSQREDWEPITLFLLLLALSVVSELFRLETAKNTLLVNWGIAALVYLIAGKLLERIVRP